MLWMITKDLINQDGPNNVGICNDDLAASLDANRVPKDQQAGIIADCNYEFRLLDGDDEVYYEGVCKDLHDQEEDDAFEPMDCFMGSDGTVSMEYRKVGDTAWSVL